MTEAGNEQNSGKDLMSAIIEHKDGSRVEIKVGQEDLIKNEGNVVGVFNANSKAGDVLLDVTKDSDQGSSKASKS